MMPYVTMPDISARRRVILALLRIRIISRYIFIDGPYHLRRNRLKATSLLLFTLFVMSVPWHFRHDLVPKNYIVWLKVVGYGVVPIILAWIGDHFAVAATANRQRRRMYRAFFFLCSVLAIAIILIVENKQAESDADRQKTFDTGMRQFSDYLKSPPPSLEHQSIEESLRGIEGKLKVPPLPKLVQKQHIVPLTEETKLSKMSNSDLRDYVINWVKTLRTFEAKYYAEESSRISAIPMFGQDQAARERFLGWFYADSVRRGQEERTEYKNDYWGETNAVYNEITRRYKLMGKAVPDPSAIMRPPLVPNPTGIQNTLSGNLYGPNPIGALADYIEVLVRNLPN
jgi:hypothetical protein